MGRKSNVFQIVGFQNSGKTTLIQEISQYWNQNDLTVGSIKHHGHGGIPNNYLNKKDTDKHLKAGVIVSAVEGEGELLFKNAKQKWSLEEILQMYEIFTLDLILIEGYKHSLYPKAVIIRNEEDITLLNEIKNIQAVLTWVPIKKSVEFPLFHMENKLPFIRWLFESFHYNRLEK